MLACTNTDGGLDFRRRRHHPSSEKNRTEQVGGEGGDDHGEAAVHEAVQCRAQCRAPGTGMGWEQLSRIHFDCVQNASEHNTFAGLLRARAYAPPQTNRLGILLCAKRGRANAARGLLHVAIVIASQLCSLGAKFTSALNIPSAVRSFGRATLFGLHGMDAWRAKTRPVTLL